ncbi:MAG: TlpA family protein disulfide reductase [Hyphomicrobiales bacterium]|nr:TlpA family protein disulfide reductase [Hyphomicrobiales bacterium]MCP4998273.1 TlpA family protein disulfide reductase [Hyphomicrobiales bacterium]
MNWTNYFSFPAAVVFLTLLLTGCLEENTLPLKIGAKAPPSTLTLLNGETREVPDDLGQAQVITFMSSWCPCSNQSIPLMKEAFEQYNSGPQSKIAFLMIGFQSPRSKFEDIASKWQVPFPVGYDDGDKIARAYGITAPPTTVFIDTEGNVIRVFYGNIKDIEEEFLQWVGELL